EIATTAELEQLRRRRAIRRPGGIPAGEDKNILMRVDGHPRDLAEIHTLWQMKKTRHRLKLNLRNRRLLRESAACQQQQQRTTFHGISVSTDLFVQADIITTRVPHPSRVLCGRVGFLTVAQAFTSAYK